MPPTLLGCGTLVAAANSQHTVLEVTSPYTISWQVNLTNMASGDRTELRVYTKVVSADPYGVAFFQPFYNAPSSNDLVQVHVPLPSYNAAKCTLQQNSGPGRPYTWCVMGF